MAWVGSLRFDEIREEKSILVVKVQRVRRGRRGRRVVASMVLGSWARTEVIIELLKPILSLRGLQNE